MFERILVPVDGSDTSFKALVAALRLATGSGGRARLRLLYVLEEISMLHGWDPTGVVMTDLLTTLKVNGERLLDDAMAIAKAAAVDVDCELIEPAERLGEAVAKAATEWRADLVVVGTHGRHGLGRVFLGSGAEQIIRLAPVPVLVVRSTSEGVSSGMTGSVSTAVSTRAPRLA